MCGRFASARKRSELLEEFGVQRDRSGTGLDADWNVAPTKSVYAVLTRDHDEPDSRDSGSRGSSGRGSGSKGSATNGAGQDGAGRDPAAGDAGHGADGGGEPERQLRVVRWGLVPFWAKDPAIGSRMINARAETLAEKPAYRRAFARRRCLLPADGFYEWQQIDDGGKKRKQPYYIHRQDGGPLAFAGLYELWRDDAVPADADGAWLWTTTIITTQAKDEVGRIHDRMPMVIEPGAWADWLDPGLTEVAGAHRLLVPATASGLTAEPVSAAVNNVRNNGPELTTPLAADGSAGAHPPDGAPAGSGGTLF